MKKAFSFSLIATLVSLSVHADQHISNALTDAKVSGQWRTMYMKDTNKGNLQDWHGLATGGKLKIETAKFSHFKFGLAGYVSQELSSNKAVVDPTNKNKASRYVLGMFNVENPNDNTVAFLGEAYLNWSIKNHSITVGRMKLNTPMMNAFDGRMIPTLFQGVWGKSKLSKSLSIQGGVITDIAIRGAERFKSIDTAVGTLPQGKAPNGQNSDYAGNLTTDYIGVFSVNYQPVKGAKLQVWDYYWDNVMNSAYFQGDYAKKVGGYTFVSSGQYIHQNIIGDGGNIVESKSYVINNFKSNTYGLKFEVKGHGVSLSLAGIKITDDGRFTKPREWGKDPLFTFQKRELGDGYGDSSAWLVRAKYNLAKIGMKGLKLVVDYGQHSRPAISGPDKFKFNRYAFPSYEQLNIDLIYNINHLVKGGKIEIIYATKHDRDNTNKAAFEQNKAEMDQLSVIFNLNF